MSVERIDDLLHGNVVFDTSEPLDRTMWRVVNSRPFQRMRRIDQLGFSRLVFAGASHSRRDHSIGVFHTARDMMDAIPGDAKEGRWDDAAQTALAAALVHDVGHGPFSHAFEAVGRELGLTLADHEAMSDLVIRRSEIADILDGLRPGFAEEVAKLIRGDGGPTIHGSVVSSQVDADRLDYLHRDSFMTGSIGFSVDYGRLRANLDVGLVPVGVAEQGVELTPTLVIGHEALPAAESYILGLFNMYKVVYFHRTTRGIEKLFTELMVRVVRLVRDGSRDKVGLPDNHPLIRFAESPGTLETALNLDDTVVWGALSQLRESRDPLVRSFAARIQDRSLFKCVDIRAMVQHGIDPENHGHPDQVEMIDECCDRIVKELQESKERKRGIYGVPVVLTDEAQRSPYKTSKGPYELMERINVRTPGGNILDLKSCSDVVAGLRQFKLTRAYDRNLPELEARIHAFINREIETCRRF